MSGCPICPLCGSPSHNLSPEGVPDPEECRREVAAAPYGSLPPIGELQPEVIRIVTGAPLPLCDNPAHPHVCPDTTALHRPKDAAPWFCATCYRWVAPGDARIPTDEDREALTLHA